MNSLRQERLAVDGERPGAVDVDDPRGLVLHRRRELLVEDVLGQRDVVVGGEHLGARGQPDDPPTGPGRRSFGAPESLRAGYVSVPCERSCDIVLPPVGLRVRRYFDFVAIVNEACYVPDRSGSVPGVREGRDMTTWDTTVDFVIVGSGGGGMVAALAAADAGASALVLEKQALVGGSTAMSGGIVWVPNNPRDAGRRGRRLLRGRHGPLRGGRRRRRPGLVVRTTPRLPHGGPRDGRVPPAAAASRFVHCPGYSDYYSNAKGGHDDRAGRSNPCRSTAASLGAVARQAAARPGPEPRPGGDDQRGPVAVALQPQRRRLRGVGPGGAADPRRPGPRPGAADQRCVAHRPDAGQSPSPGASRSGPTPRSTT